jgi:hypothetical protein
MTRLQPGPAPLDEFDDPRPRYRVCRIAFGLAALAVGMQAALGLLGLYAELGRDLRLRGLLLDPVLSLAVGTPLTWGAVLASLLLIGRFPSPRWNRRAGLLTAMNAFGLLLWASHHAEILRLGKALAFFEDDWVSDGVLVLQWFELILWATLAEDLGRHLSRGPNADSARGARATALIGLIVWGLEFSSYSAVRLGWIRRVNLRVIAEIQLLQLIARLLLAAAAFRVTILCIHTSRETRRLLTELDRAERGDALLRPQDEGWDG